jgi:hypothetical protein
MPVTVRRRRAGGRPAAAGRAGLEFVEKLLTTSLTRMDTMERSAGMLRPRPAHRIAGSSWLPVLAPRHPGRQGTGGAARPITSPISRHGIISNERVSGFLFDPALEQLSESLTMDGCYGADRVEVRSSAH